MKHMSLSRRGKESTKKKKGWHSRLWDATKKAGRFVSKAVCVVSVPVIAFGCNGKSVGINYSQDAGVKPDSEVPADSQPGQDAEIERKPCTETIGAYTSFKTLIGDYINKTLGDRVNASPGYDSYSFETPETDENANPFSDGKGGTIGPDNTYMYRVNLEGISPSEPVYDSHSGNEYSQKRDVWVEGDTEYSHSSNTVAGNFDFVAHTVKFDESIPVCTSNRMGDYTYCTSGEQDAEYVHASERHTLRIKFLGKEWVITKMSPPDYEVISEEKVVGGGSVKLGREALHGQILIGESVEHKGVTFTLTDVIQSGNTYSAVISASYGEQTSEQEIRSGETGEFMINGKAYPVNVYHASTAYGLGREKWAELAVLEEQLVLENGQHPDSEELEGWKAVVGWKNRDASEDSKKPDSLRIIGIWTDKINDITGKDEILPGDGINLGDSLTVCSAGFDTAEEQRETFSFDLEKSSEEYFSEAVWSDSEEAYVDCTLYPPYLEINSTAQEESIIAYENEGSDIVIAAGNHAYVVLDNLVCGDMVFEEGSFMMKKSSENNEYLAVKYRTPEVILTVEYSEDPDRISGAVVWSKWEDCTQGTESYMGNLISADPQMIYTPEPRIVFGYYEKAAGESNAVVFSFDGESINKTTYNKSDPIFLSETIRYVYAGPVNERGSVSFEGEGYITERGSIVETISNESIVFSVPESISYSVYYIGTIE